MSEANEVLKFLIFLSTISACSIFFFYIERLHLHGNIELTVARHKAQLQTK